MSERPEYPMPSPREAEVNPVSVELFSLFRKYVVAREKQLAFPEKPAHIRDRMKTRRDALAFFRKQKQRDLKQILSHPEVQNIILQMLTDEMHERETLSDGENIEEGEGTIGRSSETESSAEIKKMARTAMSLLSSARVVKNFLRRAEQVKEKPKKIETLQKELLLARRKFLEYVVTIPHDFEDDVLDYLFRESGVGADKLINVFSNEDKNEKQYKPGREERLPGRKYSYDISNVVFDEGDESVTQSLVNVPGVDDSLLEDDPGVMCSHGNYLDKCWLCADDTSAEYGLPPKVAHLKHMKDGRKERELWLIRQEIKKHIRPIKKD